MFLSTRGIVFHQTRFSDTSLVVKILTEEAGLGSYIIKGARGPKAKIKASLFQPLTLLDLVVNRKDKDELQHIREARVAYQYRSIPQDIRKSSILLFLNELLYKSIREEAVNRELFSFIYDQLVLLDRSDENPSNFHLVFATNLTHFLGFFPQGNYKDEHTVFDMAEGHFTQGEPLPSDHFITGPGCAWLNVILQTSMDQYYRLMIPHEVKSDLLESLLRYYNMHLPITGSFKSHIILHEVLQK